MTAPLVIRNERPDHPAVRRLLGELDAYLASLYAPEDNHILDVQALLAPGIHFVVAACGDQLLGCGATRRMQAEAASQVLPYGEIKRMYVSPAARGQRIGVRLLDELEAGLLRNGIGLAMLETGRDQAEAVRLYERHGYRPCGPFGGYPDNGLSLFYAKALR